jgi:hypothetical protein
VVAGQRTQVPFSLVAQALVVLLRYRSVYVGHALIATRRVRHIRRLRPCGPVQDRPMSFLASDDQEREALASSLA